MIRAVRFSLPINRCLWASSAIGNTFASLCVALFHACHVVDAVRTQQDGICTPRSENLNFSSQRCNKHLSSKYIQGKIGVRIQRDGNMYPSVGGGPRLFQNLSQLYRSSALASTNVDDPVPVSLNCVAVENLDANGLLCKDGL